MDFLVYQCVGKEEFIACKMLNYQPMMCCCSSGTSNWSEDYFVTTAGVGLVISQHAPHSVWKAEALQSQIRAVFDRDWDSEFAVHLDDLKHHPDCRMSG